MQRGRGDAAEGGLPQGVDGLLERLSLVPGPRPQQQVGPERRRTESRPVGSVLLELDHLMAEVLEGATRVVLGREGWLEVANVCDSHRSNPNSTSPPARKSSC